MPNYTVVKPKEIEHGEVHRRADRFAAWPRNNGVWKYPGDEIEVGFTSRPCSYRQPYEVQHGYSPPLSGPTTWHARSIDGGLIWEENPFTATADMRFRKARPDSLPSEAPIDFTNPDLMIVHNQDWAAISIDRGRSFGTLCVIPSARHQWVQGRPDYVVRSDGACLLFSTVSLTRSTAPDAGSGRWLGPEGRPIVYISRNGAQSWEILSYITPEPQDYMQIMPSAIELPDGRIIVAVRCQIPGHGFSFWTEVYVSDDGGRTWSFLSRPNDLGAPADLLLLEDGRVLTTYGYRTRPFGIRAKVSEDGGKSWGPEIILRDDGKSWDLGYPRSVQLDNGEIFSTYYFNEIADEVDVDGGVRFIGWTRWRV